MRTEMFVFTGNSGDRKCGWINWWIWIKRRGPDQNPPGIDGPPMISGNLNEHVGDASDSLILLVPMRDSRFSGSILKRYMRVDDQMLPI